MARVLIQATGGGTHGRAELSRAGRFWPISEPVAVEVLEGEEDPPLVDIGKGVMRPDPVRIGQASFRAIKADSRLRILADGETDASIASSAVQAARNTAQLLAGKVTDLEVAVATLQAQLADKDKAIADLQAQLAAGNGNGKKKADKTE